MAYQAQFVPAWKRYLQLKRPQEQASKTSSSLGLDNGPPSNKKRKHSSAFAEAYIPDPHSSSDRKQSSYSLENNQISAQSNDGVAERNHITGNDRETVKTPAKKSKFDKNSNDHAATASNSIRQTTSSSTKPDPKTVVPKKKTVTFSQDSKEADGPREMIDATTLDQQIDDEQSASKSALKRTKRAERRKKAGGDDPTILSNDSEKIPQYLDYLNKFQSDHQSWKFSKNHQKNLLKHAFDLSLVPDFYDRALLSYIIGLKGETLRQKLQEEANEILANGEEIEKADDLDVSSPRSDNIHNAIPDKTFAVEVHPQEQTDEPARVSAIGAQTDCRQAQTFRRRRAQRIIQALTQPGSSIPDLEEVGNDAEEPKAQPPNDPQNDSGETRPKRRRGTRGTRGRQKQVHVSVDAKDSPSESDT